MSAVDLHPEELFDAVRAGVLSASQRLRLEQHCARCAACRFELQWLDTDNAGPVQPTAEDRAYGEAAFDHVLRASRRVPDARPIPGAARWPVRWGLGGMLLGSALSLTLFLGRELWRASPHPQPSDTHGPSTPPAPAPVIEPPLPTATRVAQVPPPSAARTPSANALLAAARKARTQGQAQRARQLYQQVIDTYPTTAAAGAARVALGRSLYDELDDARAALALFAAYLRQHPSGSLAEEALYYRALSLDRLGRKAQAQASLRELLTSFPGSVYAAPARSRIAGELGE